MGGCVSWGVAFRRSLHQFEPVEYEVMLNLLSNVFICKDIADYQVWKANPSESFST